MDKYHIYDEIGKGEFSQVFKGREKKKISYVAIKRVDKGVMNKIVSEVQIMHKLQSPHVLRFHDWYETRNNLWLILEYCTGGDLRSILNQDRHLPESSILLFGLDIISGLKYIHSNGIVHGDLQPKNLLIDEYGILKFSDFKLARKLPKTPLNDTPLNQRGCLPYMAPELLSADGAHSYLSDLWSLGCVLYELRRGYTPFGPETDDESNIIRRIKEVDINRIPEDLKKSPEELTTFSATLFDLIQWLLEKSLLNRCSWQHLAKHPFWGANKIVCPENLPQQHLHEDHIRLLQRQRTERMEEQVLQELDRQSSSSQFSKDLNLPPPPSLLDNTPIRPKQRPITNDNNSNNNNNYNNNSATIASGGNLYSSPLVSKASNNESNNSNSNIGNNKIISSNDNNNNSNKNSNNFNDSIQTPSNLKRATEDIDSGYKSNRGGGAPNESLHDVNNRSHHSNVSNDSFAESSTESSLKVQTISFRDASLLSLYESCFMHSSDFQVKPLVGNKNIEVTERAPFNVNNLPFQGIALNDLLKKNQQELESHLGNIYKALHKCINTVFSDPNSRQFTASTVNSAIDESNDILCYLSSISSSTDVANVVFNTKFLGVLLKVLSSNNSFWIKKGSSPSVNNNINSQNGVEVPQKTVVATLLGIFLRYATVIDPPDSKNKTEGVVPVFVEILSSKATVLDVKLQRKMIAALGEMLFYIVAQDDSGSNSSKKEWYYLDEAINVLITVFLESKDNICTHFAVKALENILSQGSMEYRLKLVMWTPTIFKRLLNCALTGYTEAYQISCAFSLVHSINLVLKNSNVSNAQINRPLNSVNTNHLVGHVSDLFEDGSVMASILDLWQDISSIKLQQAFLSLFCLIYLFLDESKLSKLNINHLSVIQAAVKLIDQSSSTVIRGKSLILIGLMAMTSPACIASLPERKIVSILVRVLAPEMSSQIGLSSQPNFDFLLKPSEMMSKVIISLLRSHISSLMEGLNEMLNCSGHKNADRDESKFISICDRVCLYLSNLQVLFSFCSHISIRKHVFNNELNRFIAFYSRTINMIRQIIVDIEHISAHKSRSTAMAGIIDRVNKFIYISIEILTQTDLLRIEDENAEVDSKYILAVQSISSDLLPLLFHLFNDDKHNDSRLVAITSLRRYFAFVLKSILIANRVKGFEVDVLYKLFAEFVLVVDKAMSFEDLNHLPQHAIRALGETITELDENATSECNEKVASIIYQSNMLTSLCGLLTRQVRKFDEGFVDIHLLTLIRKVLDIHAENFEAKVTDLPETLITLTKVMCESFKSSGNNGDGSIDSSDIPKSAYMELFLHVVDTIHLILNISIRVLANSVKSSPSSNNRNIDNLKRFNIPLSGFISMIVSILSYFNSKNEVDTSVYGNFIRQLDLDDSMRRMLLDVSSRCFGIMFDLYPDVVIKEIQLCGRSHNINSFNVIASVLNNVTIDPRIMLRIVKMSAGIIRVCQNVNSPNCVGCKQLLKASSLEIGIKGCISSINSLSHASTSTKSATNTPTSSKVSPAAKTSSDTSRYHDQIKEICLQLQTQIAKL